MISLCTFKNQTLLFRDRFLRQALLVVLTCLYLLVLPTIVICFSPVYLFRFLASQVKKVLRPDLHRLVHSRSSVLVVDGYPERPTWNLVVWLTQDGILNLDKFASDFSSEYVGTREPNGDLTYPEYRQAIHKWWGFHWWRWDPKFNIKNHIRLYDGKLKDEKVIDDRLLLQIVKELTWKGWNPDRSPWEFLQVRNYKSEGSEVGARSILIFRIHHVLGDGYYILKLLMQDICGIDLEKANGRPNYAQRSRLSQLAHWVLFWVRAPYQFINMMCEVKDTNPWHIPEDQLRRPMNAALSPQIPLSYVKGIKNAHGVTFTAVMTAAVAGGIRNMMLEQGVEDIRDIHQAVAVPLPGHPHKLRNHFIFSFVSLPVGTADPIKRLYTIEESLQNQRNSSVPLLNFGKVPLVGALFPDMMGPFTVNRLSTCLMSNFPGTPEVPHFKGVDVLDMMFAAGLGPGNTGVGFTLISYLDHIRLLSAVDPSILSSDEMVERLNEKILSELAILKELGDGNIRS